jgi:hypothetical protein
VIGKGTGCDTTVSAAAAGLWLIGSDAIVNVPVGAEELRSCKLPLDFSCESAGRQLTTLTGETSTWVGTAVIWPAHAKSLNFPSFAPGPAQENPVAPKWRVAAQESRSSEPPPSSRFEKTALVQYPKSRGGCPTFRV